MKWRMNGSSALKPERKNTSQPVWNKKFSQVSTKGNLNVLTVMNLVLQSKVNKVAMEEVWGALLKHRWGEEILRGSPCLSDSQEYNVIMMVFRELNLVHGIKSWVPEEDLAFGMKLYSAIHGCPSNLVEPAKLSALFESLLTNHSLNTVVAATMHNIQPRAGDNIKDFTAINMWYERLDERYNFSFGHVIPPLVTSDNLERFKTLDPPYLTGYKAGMSTFHGKT